MKANHLLIAKSILLGVMLLFLVISGKEFSDHRHFMEPVVLGPSVTEVRRLSDYFERLAGSINDANVYFLDSGVPGGTIMVIGGSHPEEPAANLTAEILVENAIVTEGRLIVIIRANPSASRVTRPGEGYPLFYHIPTSWGQKVYRMGDRWTSPLDSWPDPEVYIHYPSKQMLAYMDIRNLNRAWPGKADGSLTERTTYAMTQVIIQENVDVFIDLHEAELEYPVISTIVSNQNAVEIAAFSQMMLSSLEFKIGMEYSPRTLHGLSHREVGDHTQAMSLLFETPQPFLDRVRGKTDEALLLSGKDEFVMTAGQFGLLYEKIDESGWPIDVRVGRHLSTTLMVSEIWSEFFPEKPIWIDGVPRYADVINRGVGHYLSNPADAPENRVVYE